jgi:hypothetical protein
MYCCRAVAVDMLPQLRTFLPCVQEIIGSELGRGTDSFLVHFLKLLRKMPE